MSSRHLSVFAAAALLFISSCKQKPNTSSIDYNILGDYVTAYVPSQIDISDDVRVVLAKAVDTQLHVASNVFEISPSVAGSYSWVGDKEIRFKPSGPLKPGTDYVAILRLGTIYPDAPESVQEVRFDMSTRTLVISNTVERTENIDGESDKMIISGAIKSNMVTDPQWIKDNFSVIHSGSDFVTVWNQAQGNKYHGYTISPVNRGSRDTELKMKFKDGNFNNNANVTINVPQAGKFSFQRFERPENTGQYVNLIFSEKIDTRQNIDGLILIDGYTEKIKL